MHEVQTLLLHMIAQALPGVILEHKTGISHKHYQVLPHIKTRQAKHEGP